MKLRITFSLMLMWLAISTSFAEGTVDFIDYPGLRLMLRTDADQQLKVYAKAGEFINVGASHVNLLGGYIEVYRPDGTLHATFDGTDGLAIINNNVEELNGPTGGAGYTPGVVAVDAANEGVWSVIMAFPTSGGGGHINLENDEPWTRDIHQPTTKRVILAWDITVSTGSAGDAGGGLLEGRVYSNEYNSLIGFNDNLTSPTFYIQTFDGFLYKLDFLDTDPYAFPLFSNSVGIVDENGNSTYQSANQNDITIQEDGDVSTWSSALNLYQPQAEDFEIFKNNKIFFNIPNSDLPEEAMTTDIFRGNTHTTWLLVAPLFTEFEVTGVSVLGISASGDTCLTSAIETGAGMFINYTMDRDGVVEIQLDLDGNGVFSDPGDFVGSQPSFLGENAYFWDGTNNLGETISPDQMYSLNYRIRLKGGEVHVLMTDVENNLGGVVFNLLTDTGEPSGTEIFYDHSSIGSDVSGGGSPGLPQPTMEPFTYDGNFGDKITLDYWTYIYYEGGEEGEVVLESSVNCGVAEIPDTDMDGIPDDIDIDDDNDGIPDLLEMCVSGGFACLPDSLDPSGDEDMDGVPNYIDPQVTMCPDSIDGRFCATVLAIYDTDGDNIPDHLDLDSDNDGISDLYEARHGAMDADNDGVIDGDASVFGANGFFSGLETDDGMMATANYMPFDKDADTIIDADDLDSDNDGINDLREASLTNIDADDDGRLNDEFVSVNSRGVVAFIASAGFDMPYDKDGDGVEDYHDLDSDNDLIHDAIESGNTDQDEDAIVGFGALTINDDGQVVSDSQGDLFVVSSNPSDTDEDLVHDFRDLDSDNDLIYDIFEADLQDTALDIDDNGVAGVGDLTVDEDGLGMSDSQGNILLTSSVPFDNDYDKIATFRDLDSDNDGINDVRESVYGNLDPDNDGLGGFSPVTVDADGVLVSDAQGNTFPSIVTPVDKDDDGVFDFLDLDSDNDGLTDVVESLNDDTDDDGRIGELVPETNAKGQAILPTGEVLSTSLGVDQDGDEVPNFRDLDADNDSINDIFEGSIDSYDPDNDGVIGEGMPEVNLNGLAKEDGMGVDVEIQYNPIDFDNDTYPDFLDLDTDNDGINDVEENANEDPDNDGMVGVNPLLVNEDGQALDPGNNVIPNSDALDSDEDTYPNFRELDSDNDGINDVVEAGFDDPDDNGILEDPVNMTGQVEGATSNPIDTDMDDISDFLDLDSDSDGISDTVEADFEDPDNDGMPGTGPPPVNTSGQPDGATSNPTNTDNEGNPDFQDLDSDNDGIPDEIECPDDNVCVDTDGDGIPDFRDLDSDDDGISDEYECPVGTDCVDTDGDSMPDFLDIDSDNDGILDEFECPDGETCPDFDEDGVPDFQDLDSDGDGIIDEVECPEGAPCPDTDGDGAPNQLDLDSDGDGLPDVDECPNGDLCPDDDGDGIEEYLDPSCFSPAGAIHVTEVSGEGVFCEGMDIALTGMSDIAAGEVIYTWQGPTGFSYSNTLEAGMPLDLEIADISNAQEGTYSLIVETPDGCISDPLTVMVTITPSPDAPIIALENDVLCTGDSIVLNCSPVNGQNISYQWYNGAEVIAQTNDPQYRFPTNEIGEDQSYSVIAISQGCESNLSNIVSLAVWDNVAANDDVLTVAQDSDRTTLSLVANDVLNGEDNWYVRLLNDSGLGHIELNDEGVLAFTPFAETNGSEVIFYELCSAKCPDDCSTGRLTITVGSGENKFDCLIVNTISPNNDGANDALVFPCLEDQYQEGNGITIFNRWGDKVYEAAPYNNDWEGTYNEQRLPAGTYFFILQLGPNVDPIQNYFTITY